MYVYVHGDQIEIDHPSYTWPAYTTHEHIRYALQCVIIFSFMVGYWKTNLHLSAVRFVL